MKVVFANLQRFGERKEKEEGFGNSEDGCIIGRHEKPGQGENLCGC